MSIESLTSLFGWMTLINLGIMLFTLLGLVLVKQKAMAIHQRLFGLTAHDLSRAYFAYLAQYKIMVLVLNLVPYLALKLLAGIN